MFISNTIFEGERSLNRTSTTSRSLIHSPSSTTISPPSPLPSPSPPPTPPIDLATSPSPLLRDVGSTNDASEATIQPQRPSPFPRDVARLIFTRRGDKGRSAKELGMEKKRRNWEAHPVRHETNHNFPSWFVFSYLSFHFHPTDHP